MTLRVPSSAASMKGTGSSCHGVCTMRGRSFSTAPSASGTMYPTQSIMRTRSVPLSPRVTGTASSGMNFGSVVITVLPAALCGSSSLARSRL
ncbi:unknown [Anaerotruncus sp. CAG:390]|nr:unknown [Anaerotruncus sp. CAG:390]